MGKKTPDAKGAAYEEGAANARLANQETWANRMNTFSDFGVNNYTPYTSIDPTTGEKHTRWQNDQLLHPEWAKTLGEQREIVNHQTAVQQGMLNNWGAAPIAAEQYFGGTQSNMGKGDFSFFGQTAPTTGANDWQNFGYTMPTTEADGWREFGTSNPTTGANDWQNFDRINQTIGKDQYQQLGTTNPNLDAGAWEQFQGGDHGFGDHDMGGGDWSMVDYAPAQIREQAYNDYYQNQANKLDPQFERKQEALEVQLRNQGLQMGDQAYDAAMSSFENSRNAAYEDARLGGLDASRMEASMLWDQEMGRSEQKNRYAQQDIDNSYRARQANIGNYLQQSGQDANNYLNFHNSAFQQDMQSRQQQLDSMLNFGREDYNQQLQTRQQDLAAQLQYGNQAFDQDFRSRQQQLESDLAYGQQAYGQDYSSRQQALDSNLAYGQQAWDQDYQQRQSNIANYLNYSNQAYQQDFDARQQQQDAYLQSQALQNQRYQMLDSSGRISAVTDAFGGG